MINTIIRSKGQTIIQNKGKEIHYNFDLKGNTKRMSINRKPIENLIAYYWYQDGSEYPVGGRTAGISYVTYEEYVGFLRDQKLSVVFGEEVEIIEVKSKRERKSPEFEPKVGDMLRVSYLFGNSSIVEVTKRTKCQVTVGDKWVFRLTDSGSWQCGNSWLRDDVRGFDFTREREYNHHESMCR